MTPSSDVVRVLLVEDDPGDAVLLRAALRSSRWDFDVVHVTRLEAALAALGADDHDAVLLDLGLPDSNGLVTLAAVQKAAPGLPVLVLTGLDDDRTADDALRAGAQDYIIKGGSAADTVARSIRNAIEREHLARSVDRHLQQRSALVELGRAALSGADGADLGQRAAELVATALAVESAAVIDHEPGRHVLVLRGAHGLDGAGEVFPEMPADDSTLAGACLVADRPLLIHDVEREDGEVEDLGLRRWGVRSAVCVPIPNGGIPVGIVSALSRAPDRFEAGDVEFLQAVANMLSEAQHRRASEDALFERMKERAALYAVSRALAEQEDRPQTLAAVARALAGGMRWPELAVATVLLDGVEASSDPTTTPSSGLVAVVGVDGRHRGELHIGYREPRPFLPDEQHMLDDAARTVGLWLEREDALEAARSREAFLTNLMTQVPGMTWTFDRELRIQSARGTRLAQLGLTEEDLVGKALADILTIDNVEGALVAHEAALAGTPSSYRYTAAGGTIWQAYVEPLRGSDGQIEGVVGSAIDITDAVRTRRELKEHQQRLTAVLEQLPVGVWTTDDELRFTSVLGSVLELIGQTSDEIVGKDLDDYFGGHPAGEEALRAHRSALAGGGASARFSWRGVSFQIRVEPLRDADGRIVGTAGVGLDVTDLNRAQREVEEREQRFSALVQHAPDVVAILDREARLVYGSPAFGRICGWSSDEYAELEPWEMLHPDDLVAGRALWQQVLATNRTIGPISYRIRHRSGEYRFVEAAYTNRLDDPAVGGVIANLRDVTQQRLAERSLRESEERFRRLADNAPDIILRMSLDPDSRLEYISPAVEALTGYSTDEWYAAPHLALQLMQPQDHDIVHAARAGRLGGDPIQFPIRRRDGAEVWIEARFVPVTDRHGEVVAMEGIARDISRSKLAEETLRDALAREQQAAQDLRQLDAMKNGFLTAVSHELRTPLTALVGFSALLVNRDRLDDEQYHRLVSRLGANAKRLERLLTDLLDIDRMTRATLEPRRAPTDAFELVTRVAEEFIDEGRPVRISGDPLIADIDGPKFERIVDNLLRNAVKHAPGDEPIDVAVEGTPEGLLIRVDDRGPGVPEELKLTVFETFLQGNTEASRVGGLGIGLSVVQTFAQLHGGRAWVEDRQGGGASFRVLLPQPSAGSEQLGHPGVDQLEGRAGAPAS